MVGRKRRGNYLVVARKREKKRGKGERGKEIGDTEELVKEGKEKKVKGKRKGGCDTRAG